MLNEKSRVKPFSRGENNKTRSGHGRLGKKMHNKLIDYTKSSLLVEKMVLDVLALLPAGDVSVRSSLSVDKLHISVLFKRQERKMTVVGYERLKDQLRYDELGENSRNKQLTRKHEEWDDIEG